MTEPRPEDVIREALDRLEATIAEDWDSGSVEAVASAKEAVAPALAALDTLTSRLAEVERERDILRDGFTKLEAAGVKALETVMAQLVVKSTQLTQARVKDDGWRVQYNSMTRRFAEAEGQLTQARGAIRLVLGAGWITDTVVSEAELQQWATVIVPALRAALQPPTQEKP